MSEESSEFDQELKKDWEERYEEELKQDEEEDNEIEREKQQTQDLKEIREAEIEECANEIIKQINKVVGFEVYTKKAIKEILKKYIK